ncbi:MAG: hypothetical protein ACTS73_05560 [Arsenophonus sp. NEOnobi-MAG3]
MGTHKTANVLASLHKARQQKVKAELLEVCLAESRDTANNALDILLRIFSIKYLAAMKIWRNIEKNC